MTDSDSSAFEVDCNGSRIAKNRKINSRSHGSTPRKNTNLSRNRLSNSSLSDTFDIDSLCFLSSSEVIRNTTNNFVEQKKKIVESIGFGGLLHLPSLSSQHKVFSVWLLRSLKWFSGALCFGQDINLTFSPEHIGKITGLNHTGIDVTEKSFESSFEKLSFQKSNLAFLNTETDFVHAAQSFVESPLPETMNQVYIDNFKVAFVIFAMGRFLAPSQNCLEGNSDFWGALQEAEAISCYNWSSYVLSNILQSARVLDWDIVYNRRLTPISCCTLILQVFYLDNVDFGPYNMPHNIFPRMKVFTEETIAHMIAADRSSPSGSVKHETFGRIQIIRSSSSCYNFVRHNSTSPAPSGFSPSTPFNTHASLRYKEPRKRVIDTPTPHKHGSPSHNLPVIPLNGVPTSDVDVISYINLNYSSPVSDQLLNAINVYQERCASHMKSYTHTLNNAIAKESEKFAMRIIRQLRPSQENSNSCSTPTPIATRFSHYDCTPDSSCQSFPDNPHSKTRRLENGQHSDSQISDNDDTVASHRVYQTPPLTRSIPQVKHSSAINHPSFRTPLSPIPFSSKVSPDHQQLREAHDVKSKVLTPDPPSDIFVTPAPFSPTHENKIFNGLSLSLRQISSMQSIDLNARSFAAEYSSSPIVKKIAIPGALAQSHWYLGLDVPRQRDPESCCSLFNWLARTSNSEELYRFWVMHDSPRFIQLDGKQLRSEIVLNEPMSFSVFDSIIRRMKQIDKSVYHSCAPLRWRHYFESDFSLHVIGDDDPYENIAVRDQFTGTDVDYELCRCRMFFVPVMANEVWWAYAFDMKTTSVYIIDPANSLKTNDTLMQMHSGTLGMIKHKLSSTINILFTGWNPSFAECKAQILRTNTTQCTRSQSGFFTLFALSNLNGNTLITEASQANLDMFKESCLYDILDLKGNTAQLPSAYVHVLD